MELQGKIKLIGQTESFGTINFLKREMVLTTQEQYPQHILIEFVQDKCDLLNSFEPGQMVTIGINIRGREWVSPQGDTKYFNSIQGWRIVADNTSQQSEQATQAAEQMVGNEDDLPF